MNYKLQNTGDGVQKLPKKQDFSLHAVAAYFFCVFIKDLKFNKFFGNICFFFFQLIR